MLDEGTFLKPTGETMADPIKGRFRMIFTQKPKTMKVRSIFLVWFKNKETDDEYVPFFRVGQMALRRIEKAFGLEEAPFFD